MSVDFDSLQSTDWRKRREAIEALREASPEELPSRLLELIRENHRNLSVLNAALQLLSSLRDDVLPGLVHLLDDHDPEVRAYALIALSGQKDPRIVPDLIRMIDDPDPNVRFNAVEALGNIQAIEAVDRLLGVLREHDFYLGFAAIEALSKIGSPVAVDELGELLADETLAPAAVEALGKLGSFTTIPVLLKWLDSSVGQAEPVVDALCELNRRLTTHTADNQLVPLMVADSITREGERKILRAFEEAMNKTSGHYFPASLPGLITLAGWLLANPHRGEDLNARTRFNTIVRGFLTQLLSHSKLREPALEALKQTGHDAIPELIRQFETGDEETRRAVLATLGSIGDRSALPVLIEALQLTEGDLPAVAAGALGKIGDPAAFEPLCAILDHPSALVRQTAIAAINSLGHPAHTARMIELARHESPRVREAAIRSLGYFGDPQGLETVLRACEDTSPIVRQAALECLSFYEDPRIAPLLENALADPSPGIRVAAIRALRFMPSDFAVPHLTKALADPDMWVRVHACRGFSHFHHPSIEPALLKCVADPLPPVRVAVAEMLGRLGGRQAVVALSVLLADPEPDVRAGAIHALAATHHPAAVPPLWELATHSEPGLQQQAIHALGVHGGVEAVHYLKQLLRSTPHRAEEVIEALLQARSPEATEAIVMAIQQPEHRLLAIDAAIRLGESALIPLQRLLAHPSCPPEARLAAVQILQRGHLPQGTELLIYLLTDPSPAVRVASAFALGEIGASSARDALARLEVTDPDPQVRRHARIALQKLQ